MKVLDYDGLSYLCTNINSKLDKYLPLAGGEMDNGALITIPTSDDTGGARLGIYNSKWPAILLNGTANNVMQQYLDDSGGITWFALNYTSLLALSMAVDSSSAIFAFGKYNSSTGQCLGSAMYQPKSGNGYIRMVSSDGTKYVQINPSGIKYSGSSSSTQVFAANGSIVSLPSYSNATSSTSGLMSSTDKAKLDNLSTDVATTTTNGLMSSDDKTKLDNLASNNTTIYKLVGTELSKDSLYSFEVSETQLLIVTTISTENNQSNTMIFHCNNEIKHYTEQISLTCSSNIVNVTLNVDLSGIYFSLLSVGNLGEISLL